MALLHGRAGRLTTKNGDSWPGQYDGHPWEAVRGLDVPLSFDCAAGSSCSVELPAAHDAGGDVVELPDVELPAAAGGVHRISYVEGRGDASAGLDEGLLSLFLSNLLYLESPYSYNKCQ
jgi:hypothetical protein